MSTPEYCQSFEEAFEEFMKNLDNPNWLSTRQPKFPICIYCFDSREDEKDPDDNQDYLLKKHFLHIEEDENGILTIVDIISPEPEGELNEPKYIFEGQSNYRWPISSYEQAALLIPNFIKSLNLQKRT